MSFKQLYLLLIFLLCLKLYTANEHQKINIVLFFAKIDSPCEIVHGEHALKCLELHEKARVKLYLLQHDLETASEQNTNLVRQQNHPICKEMLKDSVMTLVHFAQDKLNMKTAVASIDNKHLTDDISNEAPQIAPELKADTEPERKLRRKTFNINPNKKEETIPSYLYNNGMNTNRDKTLVTSPKHTEVFKIRVRKQASNYRSRRQELNHAIVDVPLGQHHEKPPWDVLDVMSHVRYSFFKNMLHEGGDHLNAEEEAAIEHKEEIPETPVEVVEPVAVAPEEAGTMEKDMGLFQTVSSTLATLQQPPEVAFLMVIFGGHLHSIKESHSPLVLSIKHVIESTDPLTTLIVLTAACPERPKQAEGAEHVEIVEHENGGTAMDHSLIPVFAKGPHNDLFASCAELSDVPLTIRTILQKYEEKTNEA